MFPPSLPHAWQLITVGRRDVTRIKQKAALASSFFNVETKFPDRQAFVQPMWRHDEAAGAAAANDHTLSACRHEA